MLDDRVRAWEHQARMTIVETHQVWRLAASSADIDDLARPLWLAHDVATHVQPVSDGCLHPPTSLTRVPAAPAGQRTSRGVRIATTSIHLDADGSSRLRGRAFKRQLRTPKPARVRPSLWCQSSMTMPS
jgi:hypothetical protein